MSELQPRQAELAHLAAIIERLAGELALAEEPACFAAALEDGAPKVPEEDPQGKTPEEDEG
jgi:hypothetical protein